MASTWQECYIRCVENPDCQAFSFEVKSNVCHMKKTFRRYEEAGYTCGRRACPIKMPLLTGKS